MAQQYSAEWTKGQKYPMLTFPSDLTRELLDTQELHLFGDIRLSRSHTRDSAFQTLTQVALEHKLSLGKVGQHTLAVWRFGAGGHYRLTFDDKAGALVDLDYLPGEPGSRTAPRSMELLDSTSRAALPPLYANEKLGLNAIAPVKFFTPDANWTWYATEFDGDDLFFGLVSGFEVELGYFSLSELESVRGVLGLPVERDLYYHPLSLKLLQALHS